METCKLIEEFLLKFPPQKGLSVECYFVVAEHRLLKARTELCNGDIESFQKSAFCLAVDTVLLFEQAMVKNRTQNMEKSNENPL